MARASRWTCALLTLALCAAHARARIYHRCELARDLRELGVHPDHISTWVCIAYHESRFDTAANNPHSGDHGIFQISELYWCGAGKACGLSCAALRDDDIADDLECALQVHEEHTRLQGDGFLAWVVYPQHCKHSSKKYLIDCDENFKNASISSQSRGFDSGPRYSYDNRYRPPATSRTYTNNPNIDNLLPPYLAITSIFRGSYGKVLDHNKINGVDWINYKYDKIDELQLPVLGREPSQAPTRSIGTTAPPPASTTWSMTTSTPYVPPIKPWRFIESNQFRKKQLSPDKKALEENTSFKNNLDYATSKPPMESTTSKYYTTSTVAHTSPAVKTTASDYKSPATLTYTTKPTNSTNIAYKWPAFDASYKSRSTTNRPSTIAFGSSTGSPASTPTPGYKFPSSPSSARPTVSSFSYTVPKRPTTDLPVVTYTTQTFTSRTQDFVPAARLSTTTNKPRTNSPWTWRTFPSRTNDDRTKTIPLSPQNDQSRSTTTYRQSSRSFVTTTTQNPLATFSDTQTRKSFFTRVTTLKPELYTTSSTLRPFYYTTTTPKPTYTTSVTKLTTSLKPVTQKTSRSTQNIFDLYLNPTKASKLPPFTLTPRDSKFKINIFSGGTTVAPSAMRAEQSSRNRNQIKRDSAV